MLVEIPARHEGANSYGPDPQSRSLKEFRFEPNLPLYRPIKAPERTPLGEDAMKLQKILFSFDGRIGRRNQLGELI
jgi:hypothetical protein